MKEDEVRTKLEDMIQKISESRNMMVNLALLGELIKKPLLSNKELSTFLLTSVRTLYRCRLNGGLVSRKIRSRHFYLWVDIFDYLDRA